MAAPDRDYPRWNFGHLCRKLRQSLGWTIKATATRTGLTRHDILALETDQPATVKVQLRRVRALERAFEVDLLTSEQLAQFGIERQFPTRDQRTASSHQTTAVQDTLAGLIHPSIHDTLEELPSQDRVTPSSTLRERSATVLAFTCPSTGLHQNSMFWSHQGVLLDVKEQSPLYRLVPIEYLRQFIGLQIPLQHWWLESAQDRIRNGTVPFLVGQFICRQIDSARDWLPQSPLLNRLDKSFNAFLSRGDCPRAKLLLSVRPVAVGTVLTHYHRMIKDAAKNRPTRPFTYRSPSSMDRGQFVTRVVTAHRISSTVIETRTRILTSPYEPEVDLELEPASVADQFGARSMLKGSLSLPFRMRAKKVKKGA